jgi:hypothetical protein
VTATLDPTTLREEPGPLTIGLVGKSRAVLQRIARVIRGAANLEWVVLEDDPALLRPRLGATTRLVVCEDRDVELVLASLPAESPARVAAFGPDPLALIELAERDDRLVSIIGWPSFLSMPRPWELALATRMIFGGGGDELAAEDLLMGTPTTVAFAPETPADRHAVVDEVAALVERIGAPGRVGTRIAATAHELIINATYDAPVDAHGEPRYAHDRRAAIAVHGAEVPEVLLATDGNLVTLQVIDRFGRLTRDHVIAGIRRGHAATTAPACAVVDTSSGGAGLGLWRVYAAAAVTIVEILPGHTTSISTVFDLDLQPRDARTLPPSLHLFDRSRLG